MTSHAQIAERVAQHVERRGARACVSPANGTESVYVHLWRPLSAEEEAIEVARAASDPIHNVPATRVPLGTIRISGHPKPWGGRLRDQARVTGRPTSALQRRAIEAADRLLARAD